MALRVAIVTVSDRVSGGERADGTGPALLEKVRLDGYDPVTAMVVPDEPDALTGLIRDLAVGHDVVLLAGGTGIGPRDRTPEAITAACELMIPGIGEAIRAAARADVPTSALSRACAGTCGAAIVVGLPGSPGGAVDSWIAIAPVMAHAVDVLGGHDHAT